MMLISICRDCHLTEPNLAECQPIIALREKMTEQELSDRVNLIRRAPKECSLCPKCCGKGFTRLLGDSVPTNGLPKWTVRRHECGVCKGVGILNQHGEPWQE